MPRRIENRDRAGKSRKDLSPAAARSRGQGDAGGGSGAFILGPRPYVDRGHPAFGRASRSGGVEPDPREPNDRRGGTFARGRHLLAETHISALSSQSALGEADRRFAGRSLESGNPRALRTIELAFRASRSSVVRARVRLLQRAPVLRAVSIRANAHADLRRDRRARRILLVAQTSKATRAVCSALLCGLSARTSSLTTG